MIQDQGVSSPDRWESTSGWEDGEGRLLYCSPDPKPPMLWIPPASSDKRTSNMSVKPNLLWEFPVTDVIFSFASRPKSRVSSLLFFGLRLLIFLHGAQCGPYLQQELIATRLSPGSDPARSILATHPNRQGSDWVFSSKLSVAPSSARFFRGWMSQHTCTWCRSEWSASFLNPTYGRGVGTNTVKKR